jgi:hypothetical protein
MFPLNHLQYPNHIVYLLIKHPSVPHYHHSYLNQLVTLLYLESRQEIWFTTMKERQTNQTHGGMLMPIHGLFMHMRMTPLLFCNLVLPNFLPHLATQHGVPRMVYLLSGIILLQNSRDYEIIIHFGHGTINLSPTPPLFFSFNSTIYYAVLDCSPRQTIQARVQPMGIYVQDCKGNCHPDVALLSGDEPRLCKVQAREQQRKLGTQAPPQTSPGP